MKPSLDAACPVNMEDVPKNLMCASVRPIGGLQENAMFTKVLASTALLMEGPAKMVLTRASVNQVCLFSNPVYTSSSKRDVNLVRIGSFFSERNLFSDLFRSLSSAKGSISVAGIKRKVIYNNRKAFVLFLSFPSVDICSARALHEIVKTVPVPNRIRFDLSFFKGYTGLLCSEQRCDGCAHGRCHLDSDGKSCYCDYGWTNEIHVPGFNMFKGPCKIIQFCLTPCHHGSCKEDPYKCQCHPPYVGSECDTIQCLKCCPPQTCDCSNPSAIQCRPKWHHDCCLLKSCFTGDTLVHTARGLVPIETIKEGDMVVTRHENEAPSVTHLRRVDQVRRRNVTEKDLVVFRMHDEDIWVTREHPFFETVTGTWMTAGNVTASHSLQGLHGKMVKLQAHLKASELLASSEQSTLFTVYDLSIDGYDRYAVGKHGLLVSACDNLTELELRDRTIWDNAMHRIFLSTFKKVRNTTIFITWVQYRANELYSLPEKCSKGSGGTKDWYVFAKQSNLIILLPEGQTKIITDGQLYV